MQNCNTELKNIFFKQMHLILALLRPFLKTIRIKKIRCYINIEAYRSRKSSSTTNENTILCSSFSHYFLICMTWGKFLLCMNKKHLDYLIYVLHKNKIEWTKNILSVQVQTPN